MTIAPDCATVLRSIHDAIIALGTGERVMTISFGSRSVTYTQGQMKDLRAIYQVFYRTCGADSGLVDLSQAAAVDRGPPAMTNYFGGC
ncbi:MAG: gpW family head-tail joining protein [Hyphomicrobiaceae bacterium]